MPTSTTSGNEAASVESLELLIRESEAQDAFDGDHWKSLKMRLAATPATDLAGVAAKLHVVLDGIRIDADQFDLNILGSAITDLQLLSKTASRDL